MPPRPGRARPVSARPVRVDPTRPILAYAGSRRPSYRKVDHDWRRPRPTDDPVRRRIPVPTRPGDWLRYL